VTGSALDGPGLIPGSARFFFSQSIQTESGAQPASFLTGTGGRVAEA
jgi:hypothetical protein